MTISGSVLIDLREAPADKQRQRVSVLAVVPDGTRVLIQVGACKVEPDVVRLLREHEARLQMHVQGSTRAMPLWVEALATWSRRRGAAMSRPRKLTVTQVGRRIHVTGFDARRLITEVGGRPMWSRPLRAYACLDDHLDDLVALAEYENYTVAYEGGA